MMGSMLRRASLGDGSTLSLDFTTGTLDPALSFTRASSGTYLGADGLVKTASTNVARFEYDTSGNPLGLLIEGSATNLLAHTERLDDAQVSSEQYWVTTYTISGATNGITGPDGVANSATQFAPIGGNGTCIATAAMGTSAQRSFSFWAKRSSGSTNLEYTLDNGTTWVAVTTTSSWQRFTIAATTAAQRVGFRFASNNVYEIWGCQLEVGSGSSSYIKNVSSVAGATRNSDICTIDGTNFSSWYQSATAGTVYCEWDHPRCDRGVAHQPTASAIGHYSAGNLIAFSISNYSIGTNGFVAIWGSGGSGFQTATVPTSGSVTTGNKSAFAFSGQSAMGGFLGNASALATTTGTVNAKTVLYIGGNGSGGTTIRDFLNSCIKRIKFFPTQFTAAQLQSITT